jgi:hypothetical protein
MLMQLLGPWHTVTSVFTSCTRCGATAEDPDSGYEPYFGDIAEACMQLRNYGWLVARGTGPDGGDEVLCDECASTDECDRLGHQPVTNDPVQMPDGSVLGPYTWCQRCDEPLSSAPAHPAPDGFPAPAHAQALLGWDSAALPAGRDLADAAGRPGRTATDPAADKAAALALIDAGNQLLRALAAAGTEACA